MPPRLSVRPSVLPLVFYAFALLVGAPLPCACSIFYGNGGYRMFTDSGAGFSIDGLNITALILQMQNRITTLEARMLACEQSIGITTPAMPLQTPTGNPVLAARVAALETSLSLATPGTPTSAVLSRIATVENATGVVPNVPFTGIPLSHLATSVNGLLPLSSINGTINNQIQSSQLGPLPLKLAPYTTKTCLFSGTISGFIGDFDCRVDDLFTALGGTAWKVDGWIRIDNNGAGTIGYFYVGYASSEGGTPPDVGHNIVGISSYDSGAAFAATFLPVVFTSSASPIWVSPRLFGTATVRVELIVARIA